MKLRIGSRKSPLAKAQAEQVAAQLKHAHLGLTVEWVWITTSGDRIRDRPLHQAGGKGLFVKEIEHALLAGVIDIAIHSGKDLPAKLAPGLQVVATPKRANPFDVLCLRASAAFEASTFSGRIGTGSLRRSLQLRQLLPAAQVEGLRGNVDTRLNKVASGQLDAVVLAAAGLERLQINWTGQQIQLEAMLPAIGQGTLAIEAREGDANLGQLLAVVHDAVTWQSFLAERAVLTALGGDCFTPLAAYARPEREGWRLSAAYWAGTPAQRYDVDLEGVDPLQLGQRAGQQLLQRSAT